MQAVALNVTATRTQAPGYVTAWPANTPIPDTSSLNYVAAGRSVPNHVVAPINGGAVKFYSFGGTDLLVDVMGYWLDATAVAPGTGGAVVSVNTIKPPVTTTAPHLRRPTAPTASCTRAPRSRSPPVRAMEPLCADPVHGQRRPREPADGRSDERGDRPGRAGDRTRHGLRRTDVGRAQLRAAAGADAVIGFSDQTATPNLAGGVIGIGGGNYNPGTGRVTSGFALADVDGIASPEKLRATFMHEIAHMVGLDHVDDPAQLMYPLAPPTRPTAVVISVGSGSSAPPRVASRRTSSERRTSSRTPTTRVGRTATPCSSSPSTDRAPLTIGRPRAAAER